MSIESANPILRELLESHGVACQEEGEWLRVGEGSVRAQAAWIQAEGSDPRRTVRLDVAIAPWAGRIWVESFGGLGGSQAEARKDAVQNFVRGSLHVLLGAFIRAPDSHVDVQEWRIGGRLRRVIVGDLLIRSTRPSAQAGAPTWLKALWGALETVALSPGVHALRVFFAQMNHAPMTLEVQLDNAPWPELSAALEAAPWPRAEAFLSHRLFAIIQGGVDASRVLASFVEPPSRPLSVLRQEALEGGASLLEAEKLVVYLPEALASVVVRDLGVKLPTSFIFMDEAAPGERHEVELEHDPLWAESMRLAEQVFSEQSLTRSQLDAVIARSAMLNALSRAMEAGTDPNGALIAPWVAPLTREGMDALRMAVGGQRSTPKG
ncbi:hypothetical protein DRW03_14920 [Corallococcus sp. H22C18031201]|nr:hypothetical protein DRW03_14920 [Corallococcus sp. H22C18031201]